MTYDDLLEISDGAGLITKEKDLMMHDGLICDNRIAIRETIETDKKKACVLAEELGHYYTSVGNIMDQTKDDNRRQEYRARCWAYDKLIGLDGILSCWKAQLHSIHEMAEHCDVDEEFMVDALESYRMRYGTCVEYRGYIIYFEPCLGVFDSFKRVKQYAEKGY